MPLWDAVMTLSAYERFIPVSTTATSFSLPAWSFSLSGACDKPVGECLSVIRLCEDAGQMWREQRFDSWIVHDICENGLGVIFEVLRHARDNFRYCSLWCLFVETLYTLAKHVMRIKRNLLVDIQYYRRPKKDLVLWPDPFLPIYLNERISHEAFRRGVSQKKEEILTF